MSETAASSPGASPCTHALRRHADVVRAIADSVAILATTTSPFDVIPRLLATLGEAFGVERIVVLERLNQAFTAAGVPTSAP
ncbi:MAG: hypothetical protein KGJ66_08800 [Alphaproteobacteria bacterium]|nr:hypothetical protein [Alphaproteobacteria bacterium]